MSKILVFGHKNPDTDAITSAISFAYLLKQWGEEAEAVALGEVADQTSFVLEKFGHQAPRVIHTAANETDTVALVDHNEFQQSVDDIRDVKIHSVVDHHRIANFETNDPIYYLAKPYGCTQTLIYELFMDNNFEIPADLAGLMVSGIISDTLLFKSPTTTEKDKEVGQKLAAIAGIDLDTYGLELLKAGTDLSIHTGAEIADGDAKTFPMGAYNVRIGQKNVVDTQDVLARKDEILQVMQEFNENDGYAAFLLIITNILTNDSDALIIGDAALMPKFEAAFGTKIEANEMALPGVVSRKKQVVPPLMEAFEA